MCDPGHKCTKWGNGARNGATSLCHRKWTGPQKGHTPPRSTPAQVATSSRLPPPSWPRAGLDVCHRTTPGCLASPPLSWVDRSSSLVACTCELHSRLITSLIGSWLARSFLHAARHPAARPPTPRPSVPTPTPGSRSGGSPSPATTLPFGQSLSSTHSRVPSFIQANGPKRALVSPRTRKRGRGGRDYPVIG